MSGFLDRQGAVVISISPAEQSFSGSRLVIEGSGNGQRFSVAKGIRHRPFAIRNHTKKLKTFATQGIIFSSKSNVTNNPINTYPSILQTHFFLLEYLVWSSRRASSNEQSGSQT